MTTEKLEFKHAPAESTFLTGRIHKEDEEPEPRRDDFPHDRDRIIHSRAFRRLMHKTQVFNANTGDHYRNRLTHTLEVMQIGRSIGRLLGLDEDLIEAIALGHDLGHTPFGHVGERTLCEILNNGLDNMESISEDFKHNFQSLRVVDYIEQRCDDYMGINLTLAVREGIIKHTKLTCNVNGEKHPVYYHTDDLKTDDLRMDLPQSFTLEGQVVAIADEIAQITHDIEDGIRGKIINQEKFMSCRLVKKYMHDRNIEKETVKTYNQKNQIIKGLIGYLIEDVYRSSVKKIKKYHYIYGEPGFTLDKDVYAEVCIAFSEEIAALADELATIRNNWILKSETISKADHKAEYMIRHMFKAYYMHPLELPDYILARYSNLRMDQLDRSDINPDKIRDDRKFKRFICDHIAGMSDQYAAREYRGLYEPEYY